jgi:hypothetical protein
MPTFDTAYRANVNVETGIRYGIVAMNSLQSWVWDELLTRGDNLSFRAFEEDWRAEHPGATDRQWQHACDCYEADEPIYEAVIDGVTVRLTWLGGAPLLFVFESPHRANVRLCSPCVPNCGNLDSKVPLSDGRAFVCYDVPAEWYDHDN